MRPQQIIIVGVSDIISGTSQRRSIRRLQAVQAISVEYVINYPLRASEVDSPSVALALLTTIQTKISANDGAIFASALQTSMRNVREFAETEALKPAVPDTSALTVQKIETPIDPSPSPSFGPPDSQINSASSANSSGGSSVGAIVGGTCGGLIFIIGVGYYFYYQQKKNQMEANDKDAIAKNIGVAGNLETSNPVHNQIELPSLSSAVAQRAVPVDVIPMPSASPVASVSAPISLEQQKVPNV